MMKPWTMNRITYGCLHACCEVLRHLSTAVHDQYSRIWLHNCGGHGTLYNSVQLYFTQIDNNVTVRSDLSVRSGHTVTDRDSGQLQLFSWLPGYSTWY